MILKSLICIQLLICGVVNTHYHHGCDCRRLFLQQKFCESDFVFGVTVQGLRSQNNVIVYTVWVENIYKWDILNRVKISVIKANLCYQTGSCCPERLYLGFHYILSGFLNEGVLTLDACRSIIIKTAHVSSVQMTGLSEGYAKSCDCVNKCSVPHHKECYDQYSYCELRKSETKMVDLTYGLGKKSIFLPGVGFPFNLTEDFKGFLKVGQRQVWLERYNINTPEHIGTHVDAPSHIRPAPGGLKLDEIPIEKFFGDAVVIDISSRALQDSDTTLQIQDIIHYEDCYGKIKNGSIVFVHTGWQKFYANTKAFIFGDPTDPDKWHFPGFSEEASQWLVTNRNIHGVGIDSISLDPGNSQTLGAHTTLLGAGLFGIEMVKNLAEIPASGATVMAFPMKIEGGSGGPIRIIAQYHEKECRWKESDFLHGCSNG